MENYRTICKRHNLSIFVLNSLYQSIILLVLLLLLSCFFFFFFFFFNQADQRALTELYFN